MSETIHPPVCPRCGRNQKAKYTVGVATTATAWTCNSRSFIGPDGVEDFVQSKICTLAAQLAAETKRADEKDARIASLEAEAERLKVDSLSLARHVGGLLPMPSTAYDIFEGAAEMVREGITEDNDEDELEDATAAVAWADLLRTAFNEAQEILLQQPKGAPHAQ